MIYQIYDVMMSIGEDMRQGAFTKLGQQIDISKSNNFQESFEQNQGLGLSVKSFSI